MSQFLIDDIARRLQEVKGIQAIVLGGSYATGSQRPDSDIDLGLYYGQAGLDVAQLQAIAAELNDSPHPVVTNLGEWGRWVNGGAWLTVNHQRVDWLYRDLAFVSSILEECLQGRKQSDYNQQPAYGFHSYIYCAEIQVCQVLYDPGGVIRALKTRVATFPPLLKHTIIQSFMWDAEFALRHGVKSAERGQVFVVAGCLTRLASDLVQTLYALNETYFLSEKRLDIDEQAFTLKPRGFRVRLEHILSSIGKTNAELLEAVSETESLFRDLQALCGNLYEPRFK